MKALRSLILVALGLTTGACTHVKLAAVNTPAWFGDYARITDVAYGSLPAQRLDVYKPEGVSAAPVVIVIHGGGWNSGDKADYRFVGAALAG